MNLRERGFEKEFEFITSRSSGAGGQHVNKTESKVELRFSIDNSVILSENEKSVLKEKLASKINKEGFLQIITQQERSQIKNKKICIEKFYVLLEKALIKKKKRKKTKPSLSSIFKRLERKKRQSEKKERRKKDFSDM
ncbi:MAG: aminoacyl-tRNA hydrolase [Bacteroidales bacterium]|nr:aminoacyl-tRNA hydrolase [Bacteroidales bacterium]